MMILRNAAASPFGRKVRIAAGILGLAKDIRVENADPSDPADSLHRQNPIGKIPVLLLEDGSTLFDSRVIVEYLDHRAGGGRIIPREPKARFAALRLQALCDGILDASLLRIERTPLQRLLRERCGRPGLRIQTLWGHQDQLIFLCI